MANLRTNNLSGEQGQNAYRGSVFFGGDANTRLDLDGSSDLAFGTGDFTIEMWIKIDDDTNTNTFYDSRPSGSNGDQVVLFYSGSSNAVLLANNGSIRITGTTDVGKDHSWHHIALTRASGSTKLFVNGIQEGSTYSDSTDYANPSSRPRIGSSSGSTDLSATSAFKGYISNVRVQKGEALYTSTFTPPFSELKALPNTVLLCCQDSDNPTQEETGKTITGFGNLQESDDTELVTNSGFTADISGWTSSGVQWSHSSGALMHFGNGNTQRNIFQDVTTVIGKKYVFRVEASSAEADTAYWQVIGSSDLAGNNFIADNNNAAPIEHVFYFTADSTTTKIRFYSYDSSNSSNVRSYWYKASLKLAPQGKQPKVIPPYGIDAGNTFGGPIQQSSQGYMYFPTGRTEERGRGRAVIMGGTTHTPSSNPYMTRIDFITIQSMGNSLKFGDLSFGSRDAAGSVSSTIRAVYAGGMGPSSEVATNSMSFITIATQGDGTDYGDLTAAKRQGEGCSNGVRGIFMGGENDSPSPGTYNNVIDFCTIASIGNASDFGDLTAARDGGGVCSSPIRGVCGGGYDSGNSDVIDFVTIATTGNATDFGNLTAARTGATGCASATRGLFMGGRIAPSNKAEIDFITIASTGNASDFGDLSEGKIQASATASQTRGVHIGGNNGSSPNNGNTMEFVTIATTGNVTDFGDTYPARTRSTASDCHGGLS